MAVVANAPAVKRVTSDEAMAEYGQLVQWEYNYKDARARLEKLRSGDAAQKPADDQPAGATP